MKKIKWITAIITLVICLGILFGCNTENAQSTQNDGEAITVEALTEQPATDTTEAFNDVAETTETFSITTSDGTYSLLQNVYTLTAAGTYTLSGALNGQIVIDASDDDEVIIELNGVTIVYGADSPIKVVNADKVEISAKKDTENVIKDTRTKKKVESESMGEGAISAKCDLKLKGNGVLVVEAAYNNGVHTTKDLTIQNLSLKVTAVNNALKGEDSLTIKSGTIVAISKKGDGIETTNTDLSSKGNQRGTIIVLDGTITVYAAGDAVQAAYNFEMSGGSLTVYTGSYSSYTASTANTTSYKGVKAGNEVIVSGGTLNLYSYDDGLHADYNVTLENGSKSLGNVTISGGNITIGVYSPSKSTAMGRNMRGGWMGQQSVSGSDGIHADNTLTISDGTIQIDSAYEGLEATHIVIEGGKTTVYATDDGVNAAKKASTSPSIKVSGGVLDITVPTNGDTDGIDSNGTYVQTGGVVITRGPGSASGRQGGGAWALDADGAITLQGGTLIVFGGIEGTPSAAKVTKTICSSSTVSAGTHTVSVGAQSYSVELKYSTSGCVVYSDGGSATLR